MECKTCHFLETRKFRCRDTEDLKPVGEWVDWEENGHKNPYPDWCPRNILSREELLKLTIKKLVEIIDGILIGEKNQPLSEVLCDDDRKIILNAKELI